VHDGWETYIYLFQLSAASELHPSLAQPLALRIYASPKGTAAARHECVAQLFLRTRGFPVPRPRWLEEDSSLFGGPFMIVEQVPGQTWPRALLSRPWLMGPATRHMAQLQHRLHALPVNGFPASDRPFLGRYLSSMENSIRQHDLCGLSAGLDWLGERRPADPSRPSILHLDFHPLNIIRRPNGSLVVLDWPEADIGDRHADVATTLTLIDSVRLPAHNLWEGLGLPLGGFLLSQWYLRAYCELAELDEDKLAYYRAASALRRLCRYGQWLKAGPACTGSKPSLLSHLTSDQIRSLQFYFEHWSGVRVRLG
jgi:aminoglycoside phosphotransferase (APT) family kinase protein